MCDRNKRFVITGLGLCFVVVVDNDDDILGVVEAMLWVLVAGRRCGRRNEPLRRDEEDEE